jgi:hypothetical protein
MSNHKTGLMRINCDRPTSLAADWAVFMQVSVGNVGGCFLTPSILKQDIQLKKNSDEIFG